MSQSKQLTSHPSSSPPVENSPHLVCLFSGTPDVKHVPLLLRLLCVCCQVFGGDLRFSRWGRGKEREHLHRYVCLYLLSEDVKSDISWERGEEGERSKAEEERKERSRKRERKQRLREHGWQDGLSERNIRKRQWKLREVKKSLWICVDVNFMAPSTEYSFKLNV